MPGGLTPTLANPASPVPTFAVAVPGEYVFVAAQTGADGVVTALRVQVSKDGVRPPL